MEPSAASPDPVDAITFVTQGDRFEPVVVLAGRAKIRWTWSDGTTDTVARPHKTFGTKAKRTHQLRVEPWSKVRRINIGYGAEDGGDPSFELVRDQQVSEVSGLSVVAPYLEQWFSSYNQVVSLEFAHFRQLRIVESYNATELRRIDLVDTPNLRRLCVEGDHLETLDLGGSPALEDFRGATNALTRLDFGETGKHLQHICIRDNPQLVESRTIFAKGGQFPRISELFVWRTHQTETLAIHSTHEAAPIKIWAKENDYERLDLVGALRSKLSGGAVDLSWNRLKQVQIDGCTQIETLNLSHNRLTSAVVDAVLTEVNSWNTGPGSIDLTHNAPPTKAGLKHRAELQKRHWTVDVDTERDTPNGRAETAAATGR